MKTAIRFTAREAVAAYCWGSLVSRPRPCGRARGEQPPSRHHKQARTTQRRLLRICRRSNLSVRVTLTSAGATIQQKLMLTIFLPIQSTCKYMPMSSDPTSCSYDYLNYDYLHLFLTSILFYFTEVVVLKSVSSPFAVFCALLVRSWHGTTLSQAAFLSLDWQSLICYSYVCNKYIKIWNADLSHN